MLKKMIIHHSIHGKEIQRFTSSQTYNFELLATPCSRGCDPFSAASLCSDGIRPDAEPGVNYITLPDKF